MRAAVLFAAAAAFAGCVSEPEISGPDISAVCVDGVPVLFRPDGAQTYTRVDIDDLDLDLDLAPETRVTMRSMTVSAGFGIEDFGFADYLRIELLPDDRAPVMVAEMNVASTGVRLEVAGDPGLDLAHALRDGGTDLELSLSGDVPGGGWSALVDMCFDVDE